MTTETKKDIEQDAFIDDGALKTFEAYMQGWSEGQQSVYDQMHKDLTENLVVAKNLSESFVNLIKNAGITPLKYYIKITGVKTTRSLMVLSFDDFWGNAFDKVMAIQDAMSKSLQSAGLDITYMAYDDGIDYSAISADGFKIQYKF